MPFTTATINKSYIFLRTHKDYLNVILYASLDTMLIEIKLPVMSDMCCTWCRMIKFVLGNRMMMMFPIPMILHSCTLPSSTQLVYIDALSTMHHKTTQLFQRNIVKLIDWLSNAKGIFKNLCPQDNLLYVEH